MSTPARWAVAAVAVVLVACLLVWARGEEHHRGDDIGSLGITRTVVAGR